MSPPAHQAAYCQSRSALAQSAYQLLTSPYLLKNKIQPGIHNDAVMSENYQRITTDTSEVSLLFLFICVTVLVTPV